MKKKIFTLLLLVYCTSCANPTIVNVIGPNDNDLSCQELSDEFALWPIKLLVWTDRERNWWKQFLTTEDSLYVDFSVLRQLLDVPAPPAPDLLKRYKRQARYERQKDRL